MDKIAFLFAGQGAQYPGMGKDLYDTSAAAKKIFDAAEKLSPGLIDRCFLGTKEELAITTNTQPCLYTLDCACAAALEALGVRMDSAAGFSLGELAAVATSGMLSFESGFRLVSERARLMQRSAEENPGTMVAVLGLDAETVQNICSEFEQAYAVNFNCPGQTVTAISQTEADGFIERVIALKGKAMRLAVSGGFHSPFMEKAANELLTYMEQCNFDRPSVPVYANATALLYSENPADILYRQVKSPVLWQSSIENMIADGCTVFIEVGAGKVLSGLVKKINSSVTVYNVENSEGLLRTAAVVLGGEGDASR